MYFLIYIGSIFIYWVIMMITIHLDIKKCDKEKRKNTMFKEIDKKPFFFFGFIPFYNILFAVTALIYCILADNDYAKLYDKIFFIKKR